MADADKKVGRQPDYKGDGCAGWINEDKNGNKYISVVVLGSIKINLFKYEPKKKDDI